MQLFRYRVLAMMRGVIRSTIGGGMILPFITLFVGSVHMMFATSYNGTSSRLGHSFQL